MIAVTFEASGLQRVTDELRAEQREASLALRSTISRAARWLSTRVRRALATQKIPGKVIRRRLVIGRVSEKGGRIEGRVWVGLDAVSLMEFGPRQTRRGVRTRVGMYEGAFIRRGRGGREQVFRRRGKERLPIDRQSYAIKEQADEAIEPLVSSSAFEEFVLTTYSRELTWRVSRRR